MTETPWWRPTLVERQQEWEENKAEREEQFREWCRERMIDPETTHAAIAYEEWYDAQPDPT